MSLPANTTCDIYRTGRAPPQAPDVSAVNALLVAFAVDPTDSNWTHQLRVDTSTDIRDDANGTGVNADTVYVPDKSGTKFTVKYVLWVGRGVPGIDHKVVYLKREAVAWPSDEL